MKRFRSKTYKRKSMKPGKTRRNKGKSYKKRNKIGGAAEEESFETIQQMNDYVKNNIHWIDNIFIYKKTNFPGPSIKSILVNHNISLFNDKKGFIYEFDNINDYIFQFV